MRRIAVFFTVAALVAACSAPRRVSRALAGPPKRTPAEKEKFAAAVKRGAVIRGMTKSEVREARGKPQKTDTVQHLGGNVRRWVYAWDEVYFDATGVVVGVKAAYR